MAFPFPANPIDGQVVTQTLADGSVLTATYDASKNEWVVTRSGATQTPVTSTSPITVTPTADRQVITWDTHLGTWIAAKPELKLTELQDVVHNISPSLGESPLWQYAAGHQQDAKWQWGTANAHIKPWDSVRHWESGACTFHNGRLWRSIAENTNVEPELEEGKVTIYIKVKGEPTFGIVPMGVSATPPPSGHIEKGSTYSQYSYWVQYVDDTHITIWKFVMKGADPVTHKPFGEWEGRPWTCLVWRNDMPPPPSPPNFVYLWLYGLPGHTHAPVVGQKFWAAMDFGHHLGAGQDVDAVHPNNHDVLLYDGTTRKWKATSLMDLKVALDALGTVPPSPTSGPAPVPDAGATPHPTHP